jgi:hypothetical protein
MMLCWAILAFPQSGCSPGGVGKGEQGRVSQDLIEIQKSYEAHIQSASPQTYKPPSKYIRVSDGLVVIDAVALGDAKVLLAELKTLGLQKATPYGRKVSGLLPIEAIDDLENLKNLKFVRPAYVKTNLEQ